MTHFLRTVSNRYSRLGKANKKKQKWRRPRGRDNKLREKRKGHHAIVTIGYRGKKRYRNCIKNEKPIRINNMQDLEKVQAGKLIILGKFGRKKKIEIIQKAKEKGIKIYKMSPEKFLKKMTKTNNKENESK